MRFSFCRLSTLFQIIHDVENDTMRSYFTPGFKPKVLITTSPRAKVVSENYIHENSLIYWYFLKMGYTYLY